VRIGNFTLSDLAAGQSRELTSAERNTVFR
jgi:16S rRNA U516 pseudouridylate synthase RsuA-like enzyme